MYRTNERKRNLLGQTTETRYSRPMTLQKSVSTVLNAATDVTAFPGKIVVITASRFSELADQSAARANQSGYTPEFTKEEASRDMSERGYRAGVYTQAPAQTYQPTTQPMTQAPAQTYQPPARPGNDPVVTSPIERHTPAPISIEPPQPLYDPDTFEERAPGLFSIPSWVWIAGVVMLLYLKRD